MAALLLLSGPQAGRRHEVVGEILIGRSPSCTIALEDAKVSRRHVRLVMEDGQARVVDLGSRNGTLVNGEKLDGEVLLLPGDRLQIGDSTVLFEPSTAASLSDRPAEGQLHAAPVEELIDAVGPVASLYHAGVALISAKSEAMVLRRAAEELARGVNAERAAALLGGPEGLKTAAVAGAPSVEVPRMLVRGALERKEAGRVAGVLCAPLIASGGAPFGILYAERPEPFGDDELKAIAALGRLAGEAITSLRARADGASQAVTVIGAARPFRRTMEAARRAAAKDDSVALIGEPGTGRTHLARYIHSRSPRALGPLVVVDCGQPGALVEEVLFGRTSAPGVPPRASALLQADRGCLLLRSIDRLPARLAQRLSRFLARKAAPAPQGGEEPVDARIFFTTVTSLGALAKAGALDADLASAAGGTEVELVPMRDRRTDVVPLIDHFALEAGAGAGVAPPTLSPGARRALLEYEWPGNVSEVRGVAERLALLYPGAEVSTLQLPPEIQEGSRAGKTTLGERIARLERDAVAEALREAGGKKIHAAALLGISRPTLDKKIEQYRLVVEKRRT